MEERQAAGCFDPLPPPPAPVLCYRNAEGLTWDGQGEMPTWLRRAVNAGQSVEFFRIAGRRLHISVCRESRGAPRDLKLNR
jgi:DNA-binding protein H-NS